MKWRIAVATLLGFAAIAAYADDEQAGTDIAYVLRSVVDKSQTRSSNAVFGRAFDAYGPSGAATAQQDLEVRLQLKSFKLVGTESLRDESSQGVHSKLYLNEATYEGALGDLYGTIGKKIMSWDVGYAFRPLDVIQQEDQRILEKRTLVGIPVIALERLDADSSLGIVVANPGSGQAAMSRNDGSVIVRYYRHAGSADVYTVLRGSRRNGLEAGASFAYIASEALELHGSFLFQQRTQRRLNPLVDGSPALVATDPAVTAELHHRFKALLGATYTTESKFSAIAEWWNDPAAHTAGQWEKIIALSKGQQNLSVLPFIPVGALIGNLGFNASYYQGTTSLLPQNLYLRLAQKLGDWEVSLDRLTTPADRGYAATLMLAWLQGGLRVEAGVRQFGGPASAAYAQTPFRRTAYGLLEGRF